MIAGLRLTAAVATSGTEELTDEAIADILKANVERLAEFEHDGWMMNRIRNGWIKGSPRNDAAKVHPLLVEYSRLPCHEQEKDRNNVLRIPEFISFTDYKIVRMRAESDRRGI